MATGLLTKEAEAFRKHLHDLMLLIQSADIIPFGAALFGKGIISRNVGQSIDNLSLDISARKSKLLDAVISTLESSPNKFQEVLDILREEQVHRDVADKIEKTYRNLSKWYKIFYPVLKVIAV